MAAQSPPTTLLRSTEYADQPPPGTSLGSGRGLHRQSAHRGVEFLNARRLFHGDGALCVLIEAEMCAARLLSKVIASCLAGRFEWWARHILSVL
ncbi:MAG TPA: hypothetical protein VFH80_24890 [Solirubrobacteraceae bacterium]|nr:hypothetical protein [Solirubrobacteraceae bacterium]